MKNKKFTALLLITMLLLSCVVTGCGKEITAKECAQIYWDINVKHDTANVTKLNSTKEDVQSQIDKSKEKEKQGMKTNYTSSGLTITDEQLEQIYSQLMEAVSKTNVTVEEVSNDGKTAEIKYKTTYIKEEELDEKAGNDAVAAVQAMGLTSQSERLSKASELYIQNTINEFKNVSIGEDTKEITCKFVKKDKVWVPDDLTKYAQDVTKLVTNQK